MHDGVALLLPHLIMFAMAYGSTSQLAQHITFRAGCSSNL